MSELKCTCGGTFRSLGKEFIRTGEVSGYSLMTGHAQNDWAEGAIPGELFACDQCRAIRFYADQAWIDQRIKDNEENAEKQRRAQEYLAAQQEKRIQEYMKDFARSSEEKLEKIVQGTTWTKYSQDEVEAARRLLEQKRGQPQAQSQRWKDWN